MRNKFITFVLLISFLLIVLPILFELLYSVSISPNDTSILFRQIIKNIFVSKDIYWVFATGLITALGISSSLIWSMLSEQDARNHQLHLLREGLKKELTQNLNDIFNPEEAVLHESIFYNRLKEYILEISGNDELYTDLVAIYKNFEVYNNTYLNNSLDQAKLWKTKYDVAYRIIDRILLTTDIISAQDKELITKRHSSFVYWLRRPGVTQEVYENLIAPKSKELHEALTNIYRKYRDKVHDYFKKEIDLLFKSINL